MQSLFDDADRAQVLARLAAMRADAPRGWGKMTAAQALAHCAYAVECATGDIPTRQVFMGKLIGRFFRKRLLGPEPFPRNSPTGTELVVRDERDFAREQQRLAADIRKFAELGPDSAARFPHGFVGRLTGEEWGRMMHKHLDHHLRQFGV